MCGPPASGKSTYVKNHAGPDDIIIDYDLIGREFGYDRNRPDFTTARILRERNDRLAALARVSPTSTAWVIVGAPSPTNRLWWQRALAVKDGDVVLLLPERRELVRRIVADPDRLSVRTQHIELVDKWLEKESA